MLKKRLTALVCAGAMMMGTAGTFAMNANADDMVKFSDYKFEYFEYPFGEVVEIDKVADYQNSHYINGEIDAFLAAMEEQFPLDETAQFILEAEQENWKGLAEHDIAEYGEISYYNTDEWKVTYPTGIVKSNIGLSDSTHFEYRIYYILEDYMGCEKVLEWGPPLSTWIDIAHDSACMFASPKEAILSEEEYEEYEAMSFEEKYIYGVNFYREHGYMPVIPWYYIEEYGKVFFEDYFASLEAENPITLDSADKVLSNEEKELFGDANCDGNVTIADAVAIQQYLANAVKYPLSEQGLINADFDGDGITGADALTIQKMDAAKTVS